MPNPIKKISGVITSVRNLSLTAREVTITPNEPFTFTAGNFVNVFLKHGDTTIRRAFSISSDDARSDTFTLSIRLSPRGTMTPLFWKDDIVGTEVELMGPLGLNTADTMHAHKVFLFGFGIGAGVIKSIAEHVAKRPALTELIISTGSRTEGEIVHKDFFDDMALRDPRVHVTYAISDPLPDSPYLTGYIQDHLTSYDFSQADVYVCGQEVACTALAETVKAHNPKNCTFFVEAFH